MYKFAGQQSTAPLPHARLERIASLLRQQPSKTIPAYDLATMRKTKRQVANLLGVKNHTSEVQHRLKEALGALIDHTLTFKTPEGDEIVWTQPYHHPTEETVQRVEAAGGFIVNPHEGWWFFHQFCSTNVYLVPADKVKHFVEEFKAKTGQPKPYVIHPERQKQLDEYQRGLELRKDRIIAQANETEALRQTPEYARAMELMAKDMGAVGLPHNP